MKKTLKIILPILLILVLIGSIAWYLMVYDRDFTREMLLQQARTQESKGNHSTAAWFYQVAYNYSDQDTDVAIELAEQFKSVGNYTKAEYTLSNAIVDRATTELYLALSKTYVEQNKLLDAVTMLENITDPTVKEELDALRPAAPTADQEPGFYTKYISVTLNAQSGTLYATTDGTFPSSTAAPCQEPITLPAGETTIYALAVGENGLVSKVSVFGYTVSGVIEQVTLADNTVDAAVRSVLGAAENQVLYSNDLWTVTELEIPAGAVSFEDLSLLPYLKKLTIHKGTADLSVLSGLTELEDLNLSGCAVDSRAIKAISTLSNLTRLDLSNCQLSTVSGLSGLKNLTYLNLNNNTIQNIEDLQHLSLLQELDLGSNALVNLDALKSLTHLQKLNVSSNALSSLTPITGCSALTQLSAAENDLTSIDGLNRLTSLTELDLSGNDLTDVSILSACEKLTKLTLSNNSITDISALSALTSLMEFDFSYNQVTALPKWSANAQLVSIDGSNNQLESIDELGGMQMLNLVYMDHNLLTSVEALASCQRLVQVNVFGNEIDDVSMLKDMGVYVQYTPITTEEE